MDTQSGDWSEKTRCFVNDRHKKGVIPPPPILNRRWGYPKCGIRRYRISKQGAKQPDMTKSYGRNNRNNWCNRSNWTYGTSRTHKFYRNNKLWKVLSTRVPCILPNTVSSKSSLPNLFQKQRFRGSAPSRVTPVCCHRWHKYYIIQNIV